MHVERLAGMHDCEAPHRTGLAPTTSESAELPSNEQGASAPWNSSRRVFPGAGLDESKRRRRNHEASPVNHAIQGLTWLHDVRPAECDRPSADGLVYDWSPITECISRLRRIHAFNRKWHFGSCFAALLRTAAVRVRWPPCWCGPVSLPSTVAMTSECELAAVLT